MSNIEEDIKTLKDYLKNSSYKEKDSNFFKNVGWEFVDLEIPQSLEHLLSDYTRQKQINEEHQKENGLLREKVKELEAKLEFKQWGDLDNLRFEEYMNEFIPKQKIIDRFEETQKLYEENIKQVDFKEVEKIDIKIFEGIKLEAEKELLRKLLQESEDK